MRGELDGSSWWTTTRRRTSANWETDSVVLSMVELKFSVDCPDAAVHQGAEELTLRRSEEGVFHRYHERWRQRWGPPLADKDWHATCQATVKGTEGQEWKQLYFKYVEIGKAVNFRQHQSQGQGERRRVRRSG